MPPHLDRLTPLGASESPVASPVEWVRGMGGAAVQRLVADAVGKPLMEALTPVGTAGSARRSIEHIVKNKRFWIHVRATSENGGVATPYGTRVERGAYVGPALWG